jgi:hypothetical protein
MRDGPEWHFPLGSARSVSHNLICSGRHHTPMFIRMDADMPSKRFPSRNLPFPILLSDLEFLFIALEP